MPSTLADVIPILAIAFAVCIAWKIVSVIRSFVLRVIAFVGTFFFLWRIFEMWSTLFG
ncbi:hypothetical protein ACQKNX_22740 [Lysinibacillus sp. NPDC093712]|uniref:hypothetical protein n=1 Tax=Lysinibacillus sp. NPDC093712 TaxID=3390579 RepID=UPI003D082772